MNTVRSVQHWQLAELFDHCFLETFQTRCLGGAREPVYLPGDATGTAQLCYREDHAASALHEISHWCLAGAQRRQRVDFGYPYIDAPRSLVQQVTFLRCEVRAQALERLFAELVNVPFRCSFDDVDDRFVQLRPGFAAAVDSVHAQLQRQKLPARAAQFASALSALHSRVTLPSGSVNGAVRTCPTADRSS